MLDIKFVRQNPEKVKKACQEKGVKVNIDKLLKLDKEKREKMQKIERIRAEKNKASKEIVSIKNDKEKRKIIVEMQQLDKEEEKEKKVLKTIEKELSELINQLPNLPLEDVPVGKDDSENVVVRQVGKKPKFNFKPKDYLEIGKKLDIIDTERAAKVAGSRFGYLKREAVLLEFALVNFVLDILTEKNFIPIIPPVMLKPEMAKGTGYFEATDVKEAYYLPEDNLFLVGTSEQSLLAMHANEIFEEKDLPKRYIGFSTCFRREAGSYGKDTRGILRVHQFDKLEMFVLAHPQKSEEEHQMLVSLEERFMQELEIPYQLVKICTGDLGLPAAKKFDIEAWIESEGRYRETHSCSNCTDFQTRRLNIRYRTREGKLNFVHALNGTALAIGRILIAIIENYQQKDGTIKVPQVLRKYLNGNKVIPWLKR